MERLMRTTKSVVLITLLFAGVVQSSVIPEKDRWRQGDVWADEYNLVEPPPVALTQMKFFDSPKPKITPELSLKRIIKALYAINAFDDKAAIEDQNAENDKQSPNDVFKAEEAKNSFDNEGALDPSSFTLPLVVQSPQTDASSSGAEDTTAAVQSENELSFLSAQDAGETPEEATQRVGVLLEDLVDSVNLPANIESDRTDKFTHSIRYGYGAPFHP